MRSVSKLSGWLELVHSCEKVQAVAMLTNGEAARELGIGASTLAHWIADGKVTPTFTTAGGHARWELADLRRQVDEWRKREQADPDA